MATKTHDDFEVIAMPYGDDAPRPIVLFSRREIEHILIPRLATSTEAAIIDFVQVLRDLLTEEV